MSESIYHAELSKLIELKTLTWLPWIVENYAGSPSDKKILLIGESHYYDSEKESNHDGIPLFTRGIINRVINKGTTPDEKNTWKLFISTVKLLIPGSSEEQQNKFWSNVAFYNFVQRSVKQNHETPSKDDFKDGWPPFFKLIEVIKPSVCIFLGTTSANFLKRAAAALKIDSLGKLEVEHIIKEGAKRRYRAINCSFVNTDNENIELIFIKHPSQFFSTDLWREYLEKKISPQLEWLKDSIKT